MFCPIHRRRGRSGAFSCWRQPGRTRRRDRPVPQPGSRMLRASCILERTQQTGQIFSPCVRVARIKAHSFPPKNFSESEMLSGRLAFTWFLLTWQYNNTFPPLHQQRSAPRYKRRCHRSPAFHPITASRRR